MPTRAIITCLLIILIPLTEAYADTTIEIRKKRGLLLVENFQQALGMVYQFSDHDSNIPNSAYMSNKLEEIYHLETSGAIVDKHQLNFQLTGDVWFQQIDNSSDAGGSSYSSGTRYQYSLGASAFDRDWYPMGMHSSRTLSTTTNPFTPAYETDTSSNGIKVSFLKGPVPTKIRYERTSTDTSVGSVNSNSTSNSFSLEGTHNYRDISASSLAGSWNRSDSTSQGVDQTSDGYTIGFGNALTFDRDRKYSLQSSLNWTKLEAAGIPQQNAVLNEVFLAHLGKALDADLSYAYQYYKTVNLTGQEQAFSSNSVQGSITHHLFESLTTRVRGQGATAEIPGGTENSYGGSGTITYRKKLPASSLLSFALYGEHTVKDRRTDATSITIRDEPHLVVLPGEIIILTVPGPVQPGSVTVKGYSVPPPNPQVPPDITFTEGTDYTVDYNLGRITWGGIVPTVPTVLVTYVSLINSSVRYAIDTVEVSSDLSLLGGKYIMNGSIYSQDQTLLSGQPQNSLFSTTIKRLRFQGNAPQTIYSLEYQDYASGPTRFQFVEGLCVYTRTAPSWTISLQGRDRYTNNEAVGPSAGYGQNTLTGTVNYSRSVSSWGQLVLAGSLVDVRREYQDASDAFYVKAALRTWFNKLTASLLAQSSWRIYGPTTTRDDYVRFEITRYFY